MNILHKHSHLEFIRGLLKAPPSCDFGRRFTDLWKTFEGLEDPHFWIEIDNDPKSRLWEMMTASVLNNEGFDLASESDGPDFTITKSGRLIMYVESIAPSPGDPDRPDSVPEPKSIPNTVMAGWVPTERYVLRIRSAFEDKARKFDSYLHFARRAADNCYRYDEDDRCVRTVSAAWPTGFLGVWQSLCNIRS